jgi:hypothetical protein
VTLVRYLIWTITMHRAFRNFQDPNGSYHTKALNLEQSVCVLLYYKRIRRGSHLHHSRRRRHATTLSYRTRGNFGAKGHTTIKKVEESAIILQLMCVTKEKHVAGVLIFWPIVLMLCRYNMKSYISCSDKNV